jgi:small subunit ribosomal protein S6
MPGYELVFIVQPEIEEEPLNAVSEKISDTITSLEGQVHQTDVWGKRQLAYPIKRHRSGHYFLMNIELPATAVRSLDRSLKLMEDVIRHLIVRNDQVVPQ